MTLITDTPEAVLLLEFARLVSENDRLRADVEKLRTDLREQADPGITEDMESAEKLADNALALREKE